MKISAFALDAWQATEAGSSVYTVAQPMPGVVPKNERPMAMDDATSLYAYEGLTAQNSGLSFPGFPLLAELAQRPEYRHISETIAREMTRKWGELESDGDEDRDDEITALTALLDKHNIKDKLRRAAIHDGLFGRGHIFIDINDSFDDLEVLATPLAIDATAIPKGAKIAFRNIEPIWTYPNDYDSANPLSPDFYNPRTWFVNGRVVHRSRLLTFVGRKLPNILQPAYGFAGLSLSQMAIPYVQNWLRTRQSVSDLLHAFSVMVLATNMASVLQGGGAESLINRAQMFTQFRDNRGIMMLDKETEDFRNVSAPISGLDRLQAQSQEQMASVSGIPLVKLLGITPSGLNASTDGEIRVFYDTIEANREALFGDPFGTIREVMQLSLFGEIHRELSWKWGSLWQLDEAGESAVRKTDADTSVELIDAGVISPLEARQRLAKTAGSGFDGIDIEDVPEPPQTREGSEITDPESNRIEEKGEEGGESGANAIE